MENFRRASRKDLCYSQGVDYRKEGFENGAPSGSPDVDLTALA